MSWENRPYAYHDEPYGEHRGVRSWLGGLPPPTKAVKWIMLANVAMFILCLATGGGRSPIYQALEMQTSHVLHGQIWRLVTFTYLHDPYSFGHIFFNMLGLYMLGVNLERRWGTKQFFVFYTLGGLVAVALYFGVTLLHWLGPNAGLVGASGGVLAVLGACAVLFPRFQIILFFFPVPIRTAVVIFTLFYGFNLLSRGDNAGGDACHLAGMAFGVAWGYRGENWRWRWSRWKDSLHQAQEESRLESARELQAQVDRILEKVHQHGIQSLTRHEKDVLQKASRK